MNSHRPETHAAKRANQLSELTPPSSVSAFHRRLGDQPPTTQASPRTIKWLDAEAALLRRHICRLADELALFAPPAGPGGRGGRSGGPGGGGGAAGAGPAGCGCGAGAAGAGGCCRDGGGTANLRKLRERVALLATRLRQFKARVPLPPELQRLVGEVRVRLLPCLRLLAVSVHVTSSSFSA